MVMGQQLLINLKIDFTALRRIFYRVGQKVHIDLLQIAPGDLNLPQGILQPFRVVQLILGDGSEAHDGVHGSPDIVGHTGEKIRLCLICLIGRFGNDDPVLLPVLGVADQAGGVEDMGYLAVLIPLLDDKAGQMPVAVLGQILDAHRLVPGQTFFQGGQIQKEHDPIIVFMGDEGIAKLLHFQGSLSGQTSQPVEFFSAGNLIINIRVQINAIDRKVNLADGRHNLTVQACLCQSRFQLLLLPKLLIYNIIDMMEAHKDTVRVVLGVDFHGLQLKIFLSGRIWQSAKTINDTFFPVQLFLKRAAIQPGEKIPGGSLDDKILVIGVNDLMVRKLAGLKGSQNQLCVGIGVYLYQLDAIRHRIQRVYTGVVPAQSFQYLLILLQSLHAVTQIRLALLQQGACTEIGPGAAQVTSDDRQQVDETV